jgi:hypothetical protein
MLSLLTLLARMLTRPDIMMAASKGLILGVGLMGGGWGGKGEGEREEEGEGRITSGGREGGREREGRKGERGTGGEGKEGRKRKWIERGED